ncbi:uncharacterized protein LOC110453460 [Mizuhopecten yessoensis]|uniref:uncharacterized protein LOC110453460 n=1 Tax=Mizuhopecten yessoensis TaxID=6573 RepID=UPI000B45C476|nr:uncharacterized protein LOC110453460 [Mizuhopecten yessoensis]
MAGYKIYYFLLTLALGVGGFSHFCGMSSYKLAEQICCDSKLSNLTQDGQIVECCTTSGTTYKPGSELCCGDVYNRTDFEKQNFSCCNGKPIKKVGEICCGGEIISSEGGRGCCGNKSYDLGRGRCCKDKLYHRKDFKGRCCGNETYDNRTHQCHRKNSFVLPIYLQRCGTKNINTGTHTCCNEDTPVDITGYRGEFPPVCCNYKIIPDKKAFRCYLDRILSINQSLCKNETDKGEIYSLYNHHDQWCCNGNIVQKNSTSGRRETCCGSGVIDLSTHRCCAGRHPYIDFEHCCGDTVVFSKERCCGTAILTKEQVCCNESNKIFPVQKQSKFDDGCCNGKSYQRVRTCSRDDRTPTCGKQLFNTSEDKCCSSNLHKGANGPDIECCGAHIRNITYQDCKYGRPKNKTVINPSNGYSKPHLCGKRNIRVRKRKDKCCHNRFYKNAKLNGLRCCGAEVYDNNTLKCCFGKPVPLNSVSCKRRRRRHNLERSQPLRCSPPSVGPKENSEEHRLHPTRLCHEERI